MATVQKRRYDAIFFDLFGTLVDDFADGPFHSCLTQMANVLGVDSDMFIDTWRDKSMTAERMTGKSFEGYVEVVGSRFDSVKVAEAKRIRNEYAKTTLVPRAGTIDLLMHLKEQGYHLGLISDCTWEVPDLWHSTPFASLISHPVFSCSIGAMKPSPQVYQSACESLGASPSRSLFIGDGNNRELTGAKNVGMDAILICPPFDRDRIMKREDPKEWRGPVIEHLEGVLDHLHPGE